MNPVHQNLAAGGWQKLSLTEQLGNVGSEISRAVIWREKDPNAYERAIARAYELLDLVIEDPRWKGRTKEITKAKEVIADAVSGGKEFGSTLEDLDRYFLQFAVAARLKR